MDGQQEKGYNSVKKALILGVTGQCGSYLADILLANGYLVYGVTRNPHKYAEFRNIAHLVNDRNVYEKNFFLCKGDLIEPLSLYGAIAKIRPDEIYNEAGVDHVSGGTDMSNYVAYITGGVVGAILEVIKQVNPKIRYFQPCTSHMFGEPKNELQDESTPFDPLTLYACSKLYAYNLVRYYRRKHGLFASSAILYNHESPRRSPQYVSRKISRAVALISAGKLDKLTLGNIDTKIDWGYAGDFMMAAWRMLQHDKPDDYVIATGETHTVREFADEAFSIVNLKAYDYVVSDNKLFRATTHDLLCGDATKAQKAFGFKVSIGFRGLVRMMVESELAMVEKEN